MSLEAFLTAKLRKAAGKVEGAIRSVLGDAGGGAGGSGGFTHPGTLMGPREVALLQRRVRGGELPWADAAVTLSSETPRGYTPHPLVDVHIDWNGVGRGHDELVEQDGKMVYMQAVMWLCTGDDLYARNAATILWAWAGTNKSFSGQNAPLEAGWAVASMARSAELLKHTWPGWSQQLEGAFLNWIDRLIMPQLRSEALSRLPLANWHTTIAEAKAQLAILRGDRALFHEALADWRRVADAYLRPWGECSETQRDLYHSQFGLGGLVQLAELAWQQGVDLYSHDGCKLCTALEFHAVITNGGCPAQCGYPLKGIGFLPCGWEVAYNHYVGRRRMSMPETAKLLAANRPERYVFHWGLGTLTHYRAEEAIAAEDAAATGGGGSGVGGPGTAQMAPRPS